MLFLESHSFDPYWNLALEEHMFRALPKNSDAFLLWQNDRAVIVGKFQNTVAEVNTDYVTEHDIRVARRLSGGGAVYHDLGNVNYTFITDSDHMEELNVQAFCKPLETTLKMLGVPAEISGRNDVLIKGMKCSGASQYIRGGRVLHHGCVMFDTDLTVLSKALNYRPEKYVSKATKSVRSRVTNISSFMDASVSTEDFKELMKTHMADQRDLDPYQLSDDEIADIQQLCNDKYRTWEWNYGSSPKYDATVSRYIEGCGFIELSYNIAKGVIQDFESRGDYFGRRDPEELRQLLKGKPIRRDVLENTLKNVPIHQWYNGLALSDFLDLLLE